MYVETSCLVLVYMLVFKLRILAQSLGHHERNMKLTTATADDSMTSTGVTAVK